MKHGKPQTYLAVNDVRLSDLRWNRGEWKGLNFGDYEASHVFRIRKGTLKMMPLTLCCMNRGWQKCIN